MYIWRFRAEILLILLAFASHAQAFGILDKTNPFLGGFSIRQVGALWKFFQKDFFSNPTKLYRFWVDTTNRKHVEAATISVEDFKEHIALGDMVQLAYDVLNARKSSSNYGHCFIGSEANLNAVVGAIFPGYEVKRLLKTSVQNFAGVSILNESFMGFIAFNEKKRQLNIVYRGTILNEEWLTDLESAGVKWDEEETVSSSEEALNLILQPPDDTLITHQGFKLMYTAERKIRPGSVPKVKERLSVDTSQSPRGRCREVVRELINAKKIDKITTVGHSLGSALALVTAIDLAEYLKDDNWGGCISAVTFACPRVGTFTSERNDLVKKYKIQHFHYLNRGDIVPCAGLGKLNHPSSTITVRFDPASIGKIDKDHISKLWHICKKNIGPCHNLQHILYNMWDTANAASQGGLGEREVELVNISDSMLGQACTPAWFDKLLKKRIPFLVDNVIPDIQISKLDDKSTLKNFIELYKFTRTNPRQSAMEAAAAAD